MYGAWARWAAATVALSVLAQLALEVPELPLGAVPLGAAPASAQPVDPEPPPAPVEPQPYVEVVDTPGPTRAPRYITTHTVWGPQGSPYVVDVTEVSAGVTLTLLPGTVVKFEDDGRLVVAGQILALGTPDDRVVFTSIRDDSVMGDTNGDGNATAPARGVWSEIMVSGGSGTPVSVFDYVDVRYGGNDLEACITWAAISIAGATARAVVSNSRFVDVQTGVRISNVDSRGFAGVYNSEFESGRCGVSVRNGASAEIVGNTFTSSFIDLALQAEDLGKLRFWFNTVEGLVRVYNVFPGPPTRAEADLRYNALVGGVYRPAWEGYVLTDWSKNWFGYDANEEFPTCMDPDVAENSQPPIETTPSDDCPDGQEQVVGYLHSVLPALSASPQVLPESAREAAAPRFGLVDTYRGTLTYQVDDLTVEDAGKRVTATRTYRSDRLSSGDAGLGWTSAFSESLSDTGDVVTMNFSDGSQLGFPLDPAAGYVPAPGVAADYATNASGTTVTTPGRTSYRFDPNGELVGMTLGDGGHELTVQRTNGQVSRVTGESGRYLDFDRDAGKLEAVTDQTGRGVELLYDGDRLVGVKGVDEQTETYAYDAAGRLTQVTTPEGRVKLAAGYHSDGRIAWLEQQGIGQVTFGYDDANAARTVTLPDGTVVTQRYDWAGRLLTERIGRTGVHIVYDGEGRVVSRVTGVPDVPMTGYAPSAPATRYDHNGDPVLTVDETGQFTATTFNERHQPLVSTRRDGSTIVRTYDADGRLSTVTDPLGNQWSYTHNERGQLTSQTDPLGRTRTITYEPDGDLASVTDETGATVSFDYDTHGRRTSITDPLGNETLLAYTAWNEVRRVTRPRGGATWIAFDADRQPVSVTDPENAVTTYGYDPVGRLVSVTDDLGNTTTVDYDTLGRPVTVTDARGSTVTRAYTTEGWIASVTDPRGGTTTYEHLPSGSVVRATDALGQVTQFRYDQAGRMTRLWTPDGAVWRFEYDQMARHSATVTPEGNRWELTYDLAGQLVEVTDPADYTTAASYDAVGRVVQTTNQEGTVTTYTYDDVQRTTTVTDALGVVSVEERDAAGRVVARTDGSGVTTTSTYDADGNVIEITDPAGTVSMEYDLAGRVTETTDASGRSTGATYDPLGRLSSIIHPGGATETFTYDPVGNLVSHTDQTGAVWTYAYDEANQLVTATDPLDGETTYTYDALGRQTSVTDAAGVTTHTAYDPVGRPAVRWDASGGSWVTRYDLEGNVVEEVAPDGVTHTHTVDERGLRTETVWGSLLYRFDYEYDAMGRLVAKDDPYETSWTYDIRDRVVAVTDAQGNTTSYEYDGEGRLTKETLPSGRETTWTYDAAGRLASATDGLGNTSHYDYDPAGRLTSITLPRGGQYTYSYDAVGRLQTETDPLGEVTSYGYDAVGRLTSTTYPSGRTVTAAYDAAGRLTGMTASGLTRAFGYDPAGRLTSATEGASTLTYEYDERGLLRRQTDIHGDTTYTYDLSGRLTSRTPPQGDATTFTYDTTRGLLDRVQGPIEARYFYNSAGQITEIRAPSVSNPEVRSYDSNGRLTKVGVDTLGSSTNYDDVATYNEDGQVASITRWVPGTTKRYTTNYTYDGAGRLHTATTMDGDTVIATTEYEWDADGNRVSVATTGEPTVTATYDAANRLLATSDGTTYTYDDGYLTGTSDGASYTYNPFGELIAAMAGGDSVAYTRDALGRMASRTEDGFSRSYSYEGTTSAIIGALSSNQTFTQVVRDSSGMTLGESIIGGATTWARYNVHGDIARFNNHTCSIIFDTCGPGTSTVWAASYDAFGEVTATVGTAPPVTLGFQAMFTEPVTGLVDMGARHYHPGTGRFTQPDTVIGALTLPISLNRYLYAHADPLSLFDPDGHWPQFLDSTFSAIGGFLSWAADTAVSAWRGITRAVSDFGSRAARLVTSVRKSVATLAAEASANIAQFWEEHGERVTSTLGGITVGAAILGGCVALGVATAGIGGAVCVGAAFGAAFGGAFCDDDRTTASCITTGAIAGGVAGLTGGLAASAGAGAFTVGAVSGFTGDLTEQLLSTGTVDTQRLAAATLTSGALGWVGGRLASRMPSRSQSLASRVLALPSGLRYATVRPTMAPSGRPPTISRGCPHSFDPETEVLMADGATTQIRHVKVGDEVLATDPHTGVSGAERVTATHVNEDRHLTDLVLEDADGTRTTISTTWNHPFWSQDRGRWTPAGDLHPGERLRTLTDEDVGVVTVDNRTGRHTMHDLTVTGPHTYYVVADGNPLLVHNCLPVPNRRGEALTFELLEAEFQGVKPVYANSDEFVTVMRGSGLFLWALDDTGRLGIVRATRGIHHTVITQGRPVLGAGQIRLEAGRVAEFDNYTGHYTPCQECAELFLRNGSDAFLEAGVMIPLTSWRNFGGRPHP